MSGVRKSSEKEDVVLHQRDASGDLAVRIPQRRLERVRELEAIAEAARQELVREIQAGFHAGTGELEIARLMAESNNGSDRQPIDILTNSRKTELGAISSSGDGDNSGSAQARAVKSPRPFVLSLRERRYVQAWCRGEHDDSEAVFRILAKLRKRTWYMLRRECQALAAAESWAPVWSLFFREVSFWKARVQVSWWMLLHRLGSDSRDRLGPLFNTQLQIFVRRAGVGPPSGHAD